MTGGYWIVCDGPNGTGKTGTMREVAKRLRNVGFDVIETREPGGSPLAEKLRGLILDSSNVMDSQTQLMLFNAARRSHLQQTILPALAEGKIVLCDRYLASTIVFQSLNPDGSPNLSDDFIIEAHNRFCDGHMPHLSIYLDAPLEVRRQRIAGRAGDADRFEEYDDRFDIAAGEKFLACGPKIDRDHVIIDSTGTPEEVVDIALNAILARLSTLRYGALYWAETVGRWIAIMDPSKRGTQPVLSDTPAGAEAAAIRALSGKRDAQIRVVSENMVQDTIARNLQIAA